MNLSRKWLNEFVTVDANDKDFAEAMTLSGSKVEVTEDLGAEISNIVVGRVLSMERHPDSDHMWVCQLDVGKDEPIQIVPVRGMSTRATWYLPPCTSPPCPAARRSRRASCGAWYPTA